MQYLCIDSEMSEIKTTCLFSKNIKLIEIIIKSEHIYANFPRYKQDKKSSYEERINSIFEQYIGEITPIMQLSLYQILTFDDKHPLKNFFYVNLRRSARAAVASGARVERAFEILGENMPAQDRRAHV